MSLPKIISDLRGWFEMPAQYQPYIDGLSGEKVNIVNITGTLLGAKGTKQANGNWEVYLPRGDAVSHEDKHMAQTMVYYHTDKIFRLAEEYVESPWFKKTLNAHTNLSSTCNAHWDTLRGTVNFYSGSDRCANTGLITDVIYHEWGHGFDANTGGIRDRAFSEGIGDIVAMLITRSHIVGIGFGTDGRVVRDLEPDRIYPRDAKGGVHAEGRIIGSTFWDMYKLLRMDYGDEKAIDILRNHAFKMVYTADLYTQVYDALLVIDDDNANLADSSPNFCVINEVVWAAWFSEL